MIVQESVQEIMVYTVKYNVMEFLNYSEKYPGHCQMPGKFHTVLCKFFVNTSAGYTTSIQSQGIIIICDRWNIPVNPNFGDYA